MNPKAARVAILLVPLGEPCAGGWCPDCALPSVASQLYAWEFGEHYEIRCMAICVDCERTWVDFDRAIA